MNGALAGSARAPRPVSPRLVRWLIGDAVVLFLFGAALFIFGGAW